MYICWSNWEIANMGQTLRKNFIVVPRHGKTCWKMCWSVLRIGKQKRLSNYTKFRILCLDDHQLGQAGGTRISGELSEVCSQIVLSCMYLARIGGPDILWSVNKLAQSVTRWTGACDERLARLISYIHHTNDYRQHRHVGNTAQHCRLGLCQDSDFATGGSWGFENQLREESCVSSEATSLCQ